MEVLFLVLFVFAMIYGDEIFKAVHRWLDIREKEADRDRQG